MTSTESASVAKLIKEIKSKIYEIEKLLNKSHQNRSQLNDKIIFPKDKLTQASRKRNPFRP